MTDDQLQVFVDVFREIRDELAGIRSVLELSVTQSEPTPDKKAECPHPDSARVDFGGMGDDEEWECVKAKGGCGERFSNALKGL